MKKKFKKLLFNPNLFIRDFLNKKYPVRNIEQPFDELEEGSLIAIQQKMNQLVARNSQVPFCIDVVFTWVDGDDEGWLKKYHQHIKKDYPTSALYATDKARFTNHNELYYSVKAVLSFLPWVRQIFIVTDNQIPKFLEKEIADSKVKIIDHTEIIDPQYLPTFNSHVIEAFLHKIPDLSENFIYFNDDVFVARPLQLEHFFQNNGLASIFMAEKSLKNMRNKGVITPTLSASEHGISLIQKRYDVHIDVPLVHTYIPLKKSMYNLAWEYYEEDIRVFLSNKVRTNEDLNMATFLVPWLMYFEGKAMPRAEICYYFNIRSNNALAQYNKLLNYKKRGTEPHSFCANDFNSNKSIENYKQKLIEMLEQYYKF